MTWELVLEKGMKDEPKDKKDEELGTLDGGQLYMGEQRASGSSCPKRPFTLVYL